MSTESTDPASIAAVAALLTEPASERAERRARCRQVVEEIYNWERQVQGLLAIHRGLGDAAALGLSQPHDRGDASRTGVT